MTAPSSKFRKQVLRHGLFTHAGGRLDVTDQYCRDLSRAFRAGAYGIVPATLVDASGAHSDDPERVRGVVDDLIATPTGLDAVISLTGQAADLVRTFPKMGISARIAQPRKAADGRTWPCAVGHVALTSDPIITGLEPWQAVELSAGPPWTPTCAGGWVELAGHDTPPPTDATPPEQPPPQGSGPGAAASAALLAALAALLLAGGVAAAGKLAALLASRLGVGRDVAQGVATVVAESSTSTGPGTGQTEQAMQRQNAVRRAQFLVQATRRTAAAVKSGTPLADAIATERGRFDQHKAASAGRTAAGAAVDEATAQHGDVLGWKAMPGATEECKKMDGKNFRPTDPPKIGLPGTVHPNCRCKAVAPFPGAATIGKSSPMEMSNVDYRMQDPNTGAIYDMSKPVPGQWGKTVTPPAAPERVLQFNAGSGSQPVTGMTDEFDEDSAWGPLAPPLSKEGQAALAETRRTNPHLFGDAVLGKTSDQLAMDDIRHRHRMGHGFNSDGSQKLHAQQHSENIPAHWYPRRGESEEDQTGRAVCSSPMPRPGRRPSATSPPTAAGRSADPQTARQRVLPSRLAGTGTALRKAVVGNLTTGRAYRRSRGQDEVLGGAHP